MNKNSNFYQDIIRVVRSIPAGEVLTYKQVANMSGHDKAYRAVGNILKNNFDPDIPCHRVVPSSHRLGSYNRGKWAKLIKLSQEKYLHKLIPRYYLISYVDGIKREIEDNSIGLISSRGACLLILGIREEAIKKLIWLYKKYNKTMPNIISSYIMMGTEKIDKQNIKILDNLLGYIPQDGDGLPPAYNHSDDDIYDYMDKGLNELIKIYGPLLLIPINSDGMTIGQGFDLFEDNINYYIDRTE